MHFLARKFYCWGNDGVNSDNDNDDDYDQKEDDEDEDVDDRW